MIGYVLPDSPAQKAGLQPGDKILSVDGKPVRRFMGMSDSVSWDVVRSEGDKIAVKFERDGKSADRLGGTLQGRDARMAQTKCAPAAHLSGRDPDH